MSQSKRPGNHSHRKRSSGSGRGPSLRDRSKQRKQGLQKHSYLIEHMDALGQGVCKQDGAITFIAKTLPKESGVARIHRRSKGVQFATVESTGHAASQRIEPDCVHFQQCPGCHYQHTDYDNELAYKKAALEKIMQPLLSKRSGEASDIQVIAAPERLGYRNRMQLHYRHKYIGLLDAASDQVIEIPHCKIIRPELQPAFDDLYGDKSWAKTYDGTGHCELYLDDQQIKKTWNGEYAEGGFTQVNDAMNAELKNLIAAEMLDDKNTVRTLLDLFSGEGNLSDDLFLEDKVLKQRALKDKVSEGGVSTNSESELKRFMIDIAESDHPDYLKIDLFSDNALKLFKRRVDIKRFDMLLLDPPRKGFPALAEWVRQCKPKRLIYVSCNAATMARDLANLEGKFTIDKVMLVDLFPSTYHFETVACLSF